MISTGVHFVNVNLVIQWNSMLLRILRLHAITTFTSMLESILHSMTCLDPVTVARKRALTVSNLPPKIIFAAAAAAGSSAELTPSRSRLLYYCHCNKRIAIRETRPLTLSLLPLFFSFSQFHTSGRIGNARTQDTTREREREREREHLFCLFHGARRDRFTPLLSRCAPHSFRPSFLPPVRPTDRLKEVSLKHYWWLELESE